MLTRNVAMRVNGVRVADAKVRRSQKGRELVIADPLFGEFAIDDGFTVELLDLLHSPEIRLRLPNRGWRKVSLRMLIALLRGGAVQIADEG